MLNSKLIYFRYIFICVKNGSVGWTKLCLGEINGYQKVNVRNRYKGNLPK